MVIDALIFIWGFACAFVALRLGHHGSDKMIFHYPNHAAQPGRHSDADRGLDLYETPPVATVALLQA
jgi:hypothetical protein